MLTTKAPNLGEVGSGSRSGTRGALRGYEATPHPHFYMALSHIWFKTTTKDGKVKS